MAGGHRLSQPDLADGYFVEPTLFSDVDNALRLEKEGSSVPPSRGSHSTPRRKSSRLRTTSRSDSSQACGRATSHGLIASSHSCRPAWASVNTFRSVPDS